ncbi:MAG: sulfite exporter TauE/SafE family protein [Proteobacteria bacterium]|nr:sulfite exporter TauE/SafE family protein [Pseudomonadota bacterium]MBU1687488.1 sulfite exporter TauE/SafE family protein [Pseudomonadota bacterium]
MFFLLLGLLGLICGFLSGLLGIGGGIIMAPLLLLVPPALGFVPLDMRTVAGLTVVQGLAACLVGTITHHKFKFVSPSLAGWMGSTIFVASLLGGIASQFVGNHLLSLVFGGLAVVAAVIMLSPERPESAPPDVNKLSFNRWRSVTVASSVGFLGGLVGQGGSFILIPLMTSYLKIPTRIAMGTNLAIVALSTAAAFIGKASTGQIAWVLTIPVVVSVIPAVILGSRVSKKTPVKILRRILAIIIALAALKIMLTALVYR